MRHREEAAGAARDDARDRAVPEWDDPYLDRVAGRLRAAYDLAKDERVRDETFPLYGELRVESHKQLFHPALNYANQSAREHLFVARVDEVRVADLERYVDLGDALADDWIEPDETHRSTEFTFALVAPAIPDAVADFVSGFRERTLIRYGYHGHYEVNLAVVAPEAEAHVASRNADVWRALAPWAPDEPATEGGLLSRLVARLRR